jgi:hypothetical protein
MYACLRVSHDLVNLTYGSRITAYLRLVILADGFQHATKRGLSRDSDILRLSIDAARTVIQIALDRLYPTGNLKFAMEANWLYISFASAFLVNVRFYDSMRNLQIN